MSEPKRRKKYTEEFKTGAVRLVRETKRPVAQVARELGIAANLLYRWNGEESKAQGVGMTRTALKAEREELVRLRRELDTVKKERDFLKRAAAFFAREHK